MEHKNVSSLFTIHSRAIHDHSRSVADKKIILNYCNYVNLFLKSTCSSCYLLFNSQKKAKKRVNYPLNRLTYLFTIG